VGRKISCDATLKCSTILRKRRLNILSTGSILSSASVPVL
jgi:hypothetical protein